MLVTQARGEWGGRSQLSRIPLSDASVYFRADPPLLKHRYPGDNHGD